MRAMIVAAGLGTRLRPLTNLRAKPALPVRGLPLIASTLAWLHEHGVDEAVINVHHRPETLETAARDHCPSGMRLHFSHETELLDTGGGIRRVANFLRDSDPSILVGGDMRIAADLSAFVAEHRAQDSAISLLLKEDPRAKQFGTVAIDAASRVCRIGSRFDFGGEARAGVYTWVNAVSPRAFDALPDQDVFSHFDGWIAPMLANKARDIRGSFQPCQWEPVGTPLEYLRANLDSSSGFGSDARAEAAGARFENDCVIGAGAKIAAGARLRRVVVWDNERVPSETRAESGVFAGGQFLPIVEKNETA